MKRSAGLLACLGVALVLGALARAAAAPAPSFARAARYATGDGANSLAVGDLNGDGRPDLATANVGDAGTDECDTRSVSVLLNRGRGKFRAKDDYPARRCPAAVAIGDLNGDGKADLATANWTDPDSPTSTVSVFANRGDGTFGQRQDFATGSGAATIATADLNGDGALDVVTASGDSLGCAYVEAATVLLNDGDGGFEPRRSYATGTCPTVTLGDVSGDGAPDIVTADTTSNTVSVLLNRGDGTFDARHAFRVRGEPASVAIGDLNGDRRPDLAVNGDDGGVDVLLNRGAGSFGSKSHYLTGSSIGAGARSVAIADINGDGASDVVSSNNEPNSVTLLLNRGKGRLFPKIDYRAGVFELLSIAAADVNADRRLDIVTADGDGAVFVLLNRPRLCNVQPVRGLKLAAAKTKIARGHCRVGRVSFVHSKDPQGVVVKQRPSFGAVRPAGSRVDLVVSLGRKR